MYIHVRPVIPRSVRTRTIPVLCLFLNITPPPYLVCSTSLSLSLFLRFFLHGRLAVRRAAPSTTRKMSTPQRLCTNMALPPTLLGGCVLYGRPALCACAPPFQYVRITSAGSKAAFTPTECHGIFHPPNILSGGYLALALALG